MIPATPARCGMFDISDTAPAEVTPPLLDDERGTHRAHGVLERNYDVRRRPGPWLADVAAGLAEEYWADHRRDILPIVDGSFFGRVR